MLAQDMFLWKRVQNVFYIYITFKLTSDEAIASWIHMLNTIILLARVSVSTATLIIKNTITARV